MIERHCELNQNVQTEIDNDSDRIYNESRPR